MSTTSEERTGLCLRQVRKGLDYVYDKRGKDWTMSTTSGKELNYVYDK